MNNITEWTGLKLSEAFTIAKDLKTGRSIILSRYSYHYTTGRLDNVILMQHSSKKSHATTQDNNCEIVWMRNIHPVCEIWHAAPSEWVCTHQVHHATRSFPALPGHHHTTTHHFHSPSVHQPPASILSHQHSELLLNKIVNHSQYQNMTVFGRFQCHWAFSALMLLVGWQEGHPAWVVGCWHGYLSGERCRFAYSPADAIATHYLLLQLIHIGFTFLVLADVGSPGERAVKWV